MLDIDPQANLFAWFSIRRRRLGEEGDGLLVQGLSSWRLGSELGRLRGEYDPILVVSPPHAESDARAAIRKVGLVLMPCQPNALDVWASAATLELAQTARTGALLVLNRAPPRGRAAEQKLRRSPGCAGRLRPRCSATGRSIGEGRGVAESAPGRPAGRGDRRLDRRGQGPARVAGPAPQPAEQGQGWRQRWITGAAATSATRPAPSSAAS
jgi:chromosome partitioning protein